MGPNMVTLSWTKKSAGRWLLKAADGSIWAAVVPYRSEFACKNQFKAACLNTEFGTFTKFDGNQTIHWTTGIGAAAAKRGIENWLSRRSCAVDGFQIN